MGATVFYLLMLKIVHPNESSQEFRYYPLAIKLDILEVVMLLMTYLIKYVFQIKQKI